MSLFAASTKFLAYALTVEAGVLVAATKAISLAQADGATLGPDNRVTLAVVGTALVFATGATWKVSRILAKSDSRWKELKRHTRALEKTAGEEPEWDEDNDD